MTNDEIRLLARNLIKDQGQRRAAAALGVSIKTALALAAEANVQYVSFDKVRNTYVAPNNS